jgi:hypothetical protein
MATNPKWPSKQKKALNGKNQMLNNLNNPRE